MADASIQAPNFGFDAPTVADEQAAMREIISHLLPKKEEDVRMVAAALKTHGPKFESAFLEWATPYGRYKAKGLWAKVKPDPDAMTEVIERQVIAANDKYQIFGPVEIKALSPIEWAIKGVLPRRGVSMIFGPSGSGKSFVALNMIYAIAEGSEFFGRLAKQAPILYVGLEGQAGIKNRIIAMERAQGRPMPEFMRVLLTNAFSITNPQQVEKLAKECPQGCIVVIDTLNQAAPNADENSSKDMGLILAGAKRLAELVEGNCVLIHHSGKNAQAGERGHSSLRAALDCSIEVSRNDDRRSWKVAKAKDGKDGEEHAFRLEIVEVGMDEDGDAVTSCVVVPDESPVAPGAKPMNKLQKLGMESFREACRTSGGMDEQGNFTGLHRELWRPVFYRMYADAPSDDARRTAFNRVLKDLVKRQELTEQDNVYRLAGLAAQLVEACIAKVIQKGRPGQSEQANEREQQPNTFAPGYRTNRTHTL
ncbi:AAA family ATPase [Thiobacillus sp. 65-1402]|uniref:AAA family ATPase n=1 Tax=Thiobacillus sp. 65-1402 TaxID=1895861 RepID=UPI0008684343|nr:AAA family ATPase [Thiobacillus sp. 65-1402]ODU04045.1 MAG: hypothetical protein ABS89_04055 [Thiobacillus sp. SCN 63-1177]OJW75456.1 MAG: hypothetical protein BGO62_02805 [Thiobacillus sp. 65-1402]